MADRGECISEKRVKKVYIGEIGGRFMSERENEEGIRRRDRVQCISEKRE